MNIYHFTSPGCEIVNQGIIEISFLVHYPDHEFHYVIITRKCVLITLLLRFPSVARKSHLCHMVAKPSLPDIAAASQRG